MKPWIVIKVEDELFDYVARLARDDMNRGYDAVMYMQNQREYNAMHGEPWTRDTSIIFCDNERTARDLMKMLSDKYPGAKYMYCQAKQIRFREPGPPVIANVTEQGIMPE